MPSFRNKPVDVVIDVRSKLEFWMGHLDGAICMPVGSIATEIAKHPEITPQSKVLLVCASGARSRVAAGILASLGYRRVTDAGAMSTARPYYAA